jgi:hypothetical protein
VCILSTINHQTRRLQSRWFAPWDLRARRRNVTNKYYDPARQLRRLASLGGQSSTSDRNSNNNESIHVIPSDGTINKFSIFINSKLELSIIGNLLFYLSSFSKLDRILKIVYCTIGDDIVEFARLYENWNAIRHLN